MIDAIYQLSYISDKQFLTRFIHDLYIFNNDYFELKQINHLGIKADLITAQITSATTYLNFLKRQQVKKQKSNSIETIKQNILDEKKQAALPITNINNLDEEIFTEVPQSSHTLYRKFNDTYCLLEAAFPYPEIRAAQQRILQLLRQCDDKKFIIIEAMPGAGKSAIAKTIASHCGSGYILTATKQLQDQYTNEFHDIASIKGKGAYACARARFESCKSGPCLKDPADLRLCIAAHSCPYLNAKAKAQSADITVTSYAYFFTWLNARCKQNFSPREILILDEAHLLDSQMTTWAELTLNPKHLDNIYHITQYIDRLDEMCLVTMPNFDDNYTNNNKRIIDLTYMLLHKVRNLMVSDLNKAKDKTKASSILSTSWGDAKDTAITDIDKRYKRVLQLKESLEQILQKLYLFQNASNKDEWLLSSQINTLDKTSELQIKPLYMSKLFRSFIEKYGKKHIIFMSATILNAKLFCEELGITRDEVAIIKQDSIFDPKRSPILYNPIGKMSYAYLQSTMPKIIDTIRKILAEHKHDKGIIHTGNYTIASKICEFIKDKRLMMKTTYENNEALLRRHERSKNGVLVSPSLGTGTDLKDDMARFQVIVKLPFMSLADKRVKKKAELDSNWYNCEMLRALIQSSGRATRSEDDYSVTYILDSSFKYWVQKYASWLPQSFLKRIYWSGIIDDDEFQIVKR